MPVSNVPSDSHDDPSPPSHPTDFYKNEPPRRSFLTSAAALVIGLVVGLVPTVLGALFFLDPLLRKKKERIDESQGEDAGFVKVHVTLDQLKESPVPLKVPIIASKVDKWNKYPDQPIGSVYLRWAENDQVLAFNVTCPHLGCAVEHRQNPVEQVPEFYCPCHNSAFALDGSKKNAIPPRAMDTVDAKIKNGNEIWVKYQDFRATLTEKVPV